MKQIALPFLFLLLSGCAFGQTVDYESGNWNFETDRIAEKQATVVFYDQRPYVLSGDKNPNFVGLTRSLAGIPYPTATKSGRDLVADMAILMRNTLDSQGFQSKVFSVPHNTKSEDIPKIAAKNGGGDTLLLFTIYEWKTDTYVNPTLHYNVQLTAMDNTGRVLGEASERGIDPMGAGQRPERVSLGVAASDIFGLLLNADSMTAALGGVTVSKPISEKFETNKQPSDITETPNCTTASILGMKKLGLSDTQIKAACPDAASQQDANKLKSNETERNSAEITSPEAAKLEARTLGQCQAANGQWDVSTNSCF